MRWILLCCLVVLTGCGKSDEQMAKDRAFALEHMCIRRHGTPVMRDGELLDCKYPWSVHVDHESHIGVKP